MARPHPEWHHSDDGWRLGRYAVVLEAPGHWALTVDGAVRSEHSRASDAAAAAQLADRRRRRRLKILRNGMIIAVASIGWLAALAWRFVPNDAYPPALESVLSLEEAYRSVADGSVSVDSFTGPLRGGAFTAPSPINLGGDEHAVERDFEALVLPSGGECFVTRWSPGPNPRRYDILTGVLTAAQPCEVSPRLLQHGLFVKSWFQPTDGAAFDWANVLPPEEIQASWFIPVVAAMVLVILNGFIGITLAAVSPPRCRLPALPLGVGETLREPRPAGHT